MTVVLEPLTEENLASALVTKGLRCAAARLVVAPDQELLARRIVASTDPETGEPIGDLYGAAIEVDYELPEGAWAVCG